MGNNQFGHDTTTDEVLKNTDLTGKYILITGGSAGLGAQTAYACAKKGANVIITARNIEKAQKITEKIKKQTHNSNIHIETLDLTSFDNIKNFARTVLQKYPKIDIIINNAGIMATPFEKTNDGYESQFGVNHLGHFLMTACLIPALKNAENARVVALSSLAHWISPIVFEDINFEKRDYDKWSAYGQSKTANALFAVELDRRYKNQNIRAFSVHPGVIQTELTRHMPEQELEAMRKMWKENNLKLKTVESGAATSVFAATAPELNGKGGLYLENCRIAEINEENGIEGVRPYAVNPENAQKLWDISEKMTGQKFES